MNYFPLILLSLTVFSGVIVLVDWLLLRQRRKRENNSNLGRGDQPLVIEYARSFFPVLLVVLVIRSFIAQPYRVPTGSLEPTVMPGDFILVTQYNYGLHFPVWHWTLLNTGEPKRGQVALFHYPVNPHITFVKRVIGVPGDHISYINKVLYINGKKIKQTFVKRAKELGSVGHRANVKAYQETINGVTHQLYVRPDQPARNFYNLVVPKGMYFMMGDNRDDSDDSRFWGFVSASAFIGEGQMVLFSWDSRAPHFWDKIRWDRMGDSL